MLTLQPLSSEEMAVFQKETEKTYQDFARTTFIRFFDDQTEQDFPFLTTCLTQILRSATRYNADIGIVKEELDTLYEESKNRAEFYENLRKYGTRFPYNYGIHDAILSRTIKRGIGYREKTFHPSFPEDFKNNNTLFFRIHAPTEYELATSFITWLNTSSPAQEAVVLPKQENYQNKFTYINQEFRLSKAIFSTMTDVQSFLNALTEDSKISLTPAFFKTLQDNDLSAFLAELKTMDPYTKKKARLGNNRIYFRLLSNTYASKREELLTATPRECLKAALAQMNAELKILHGDLLFANTHASIRDTSKELPIDIVMISKDPRLIARKSTYVFWEGQKDKNGEPIETCMCADGSNHDHYVPLSIGKGTLIAVGLNSHHLDKWLCRMDINPFENKKHEIFYKPNNLYGQTSKKFTEIVNQICSEWNKGKTGRFRLSKQIYADGNSRRIDVAAPAPLVELSKSADR